MAAMSAVGRMICRNKNGIYRILKGPSSILIKSASNDSGDIPDPFKPPPIREFTGPEHRDLGWKDDGFGLGDYPNMPTKPAELRDPYKTYFDQQERRDFGEPLNEDDDILSIWAPDPWEKAGVPPGEAILQLSLALGLLGCLIFYSECVEGPDKDPAAPKEYPFNNLYLELGNDPAKEPENYKMRKMPMNYPY